MTNEDLARLARNLKTAREARKISQTEAGRAVGKSRQTIVNWESPESTAEPSTSELATLASKYGVSARDLRFEDLERQPAAVRPTHAPTIEAEPDGSVADVLRDNAKSAEQGRG